MTDTVDYISYTPEMLVYSFDPRTEREVRFGQVTPDRMFVDIVLPMGEQEKMPVFQDITIMMTIHWTSSQYADIELTKDITFQNLLYTIKFEPSSNVLFPDLVPSLTNVVRGEDLVLDASNSYISNMALVQQRRSLAFDWTCPDILV